MQPLVLLPTLLLARLGSAFQGRRQSCHVNERVPLPPPRARLHRVSHTEPTLRVGRRTSVRFLADDDDNDSTDPIGESRQKRLIECSAAIVLPFSSEVAFDAFSDLSRQPSWCRYLDAVEYVGIVDDCSADDEDCSPLRSSRWTVAIK